MSKAQDTSQEFRLVLAKAFHDRHTARTPINKREAAFFKFHDNNPHVYERFCQIVAEEVIPRGKTNFSSRMVIEHLRWLEEMSTRCDDSFKLNDHHSSGYSRLFTYDFLRDLDVLPLCMKLVEGEASYINQNISSVSPAVRDIIKDALDKAAGKAVIKKAA